MKQNTVKIDSRLFEAAEMRLKEAGWEAEPEEALAVLKGSEGKN